MAIGASEAETFWTGFLRGLTRRGLRGVKLVIADDHKGLKAAATRILGATAQRCRVHFMRNLLAHAGKQGRRVVSAFVAQPSRPGRCRQCRRLRCSGIRGQPLAGRGRRMVTLADTGTIAPKTVGRRNGVRGRCRATSG